MKQNTTIIRRVSTSYTDSKPKIRVLDRIFQNFENVPNSTKGINSVLLYITSLKANQVVYNSVPKVCKISASQLKRYPRFFGTSFHEMFFKIWHYSVNTCTG